MSSLLRLREFVVEATRVVERAPDDERAQLAGVRPLLADLVAHDDWLPDEYATPDAQYYRQYLLHEIGRAHV